MSKDRRVRRTRQRLHQALLELIEERGYTELTVSDIAERADIGRSTFYSHFLSKDDLLFAGFQEWLFSLVDKDSSPGQESGTEGSSGPMQGRVSFAPPLLAHVASQKNLFLALISGQAGRQVRRRVMEYMTATVHKELGTAPMSGDLLAEGRARGLAAGFLGLATWWLEDASRLSPEEVSRIVDEMWFG